LKKKDNKKYEENWYTAKRNQLDVTRTSRPAGLVPPAILGNGSIARGAGESKSHGRGTNAMGRAQVAAITTPFP
jgi:hypothetical protein